MKFDILSAYRQHLQSTLKNRNTADRYYFAVVKLLNNYQFDSLNEISRETLESELMKCRGKNDFSATKNGLLHLHNFDNRLNIPDSNFFKEQSLKKRNRSKRPAKTLYLDTITRKVNAVKDEKLKLAYRLMLISGLRVGETSQLTKEDVSIDGDSITVNVRYGKGGSNGRVECMQDVWLAARLQDFCKDKEDEEKLFYAQPTMRQKANALGLECHDFRRIAAINYRKEQLQQGTTFPEANEQTKDFLRHARFSTTKRYLFNRKLKIKRPDPPEQKHLNNE